MAGEEPAAGGRGRRLYCFPSGFFILFFSFLHLFDHLYVMITKIVHSFKTIFLLDSWNLLCTKFAGRYFRSNGQMGMT